MKRLIIWVLIGPAAVLFGLLLFANRHSVMLKFDPFSSANPAYALEAPLLYVIVTCFFFGAVLGGCSAWLGQHKWRRTAREGVRDVRHWQAEADSARARGR